MTDKLFQSNGTVAIRIIGTVNWLGLWTLYSRECRRFLKVWQQTLGAPATTTILFMVIFSLALGADREPIAGVAFTEFLAPGLIIMTIIQNAFSNTSSSILISKVQGNIIDTLMPPLSAFELMIGYALGGLTRGIVVGVGVGLVFWLSPIATLSIDNIFVMIYFAVSASLLLSFLGIITGMWADKFDNSAAISNFIIAPLSLLSGTFYSVEKLGDGWQLFSSINPFFYFIDGFRRGAIGVGDSDLLIGIIYTLILNLIVGCAVFILFKRGYKLKS